MRTNASFQAPQGGGGGQTDHMKRERAPLLIFLVPLLAAMLALALLLGAMKSPGLLLVHLISDPLPAQAVLECCWWGCRLMVAAPVAGLAIALAASIWAIVWVVRRWASLRQIMQMIGITVVLLGLVGLLSAALLWQEDIPGLSQQAEEDMAQLASGELEQAVVWFSLEPSESTLPSPFGGGQDALITCYNVNGEGTDGWILLRVPAALGFAPNPDRPYSQGQSISWNLENAQQYQISYTSNFHVAVEIIPS